MNVAAILARACEMGVQMHAVGNDLRARWSARDPPPPDLIAAIRANKSAILALLAASSDVDRWRAYYDGRAAIHAQKRGLSRREVERRALEDVVQHWLAKHPMAASGRADGCAHCGRPNPDTPLLARDGHTWVHARCWTSLMASRAGEVRHSLIRLLNLPEDFDAGQTSSIKHDASLKGE